MECPTLHLQMTDDGDELNGLRLLVVEDDYLVAADMCSALERRGATILGPTGSLRKGRELVLQHHPDCALLDINLNGTLAFELAEECKRQRVPTIFTTGYDNVFFPDTFRDSLFVLKPVNLNTLVRLIRHQAQRAA